MIHALRQKIGVFILSLIRARHGVVIFFHDQERREALRKITTVKQEVKMLLTEHEAYQIVMAVRRTSKISGDIAEVGTYEGGSSKLIAETRGTGSNKHIYLFDTFEGLPELQDIDRSNFSDKQYQASYEKVKAYLSAYPGISIFKGIFPASGTAITNKRFSFVHLDVDLYEATKESLEFFYPRMERGGVIISHDYLTAPGVRKAVDEFMADKPEAVFESSTAQCFIVKL